MIGTKESLGETYLGHSGSMGKQDVADVWGVGRVGEALRAHYFFRHLVSNTFACLGGSTYLAKGGLAWLLD